MPDDIANLVLHQLWREVQAGRPLADGLADTASLLSTLSLLTDQQVQKVRCYDRRGKRAVARTVALETDLPAAGSALPAVVELPGGLTARQRRIAGLLADGWLQEELPAVLDCSLSTVYRDVKVLRGRLRAAGR